MVRRTRRPPGTVWTRCRSPPARIRDNIEQVIEGKPEVVRARARRAARRGPPADRGRAGRRQDDAGQGAGPLDRLLGAAHPVHARPAAAATSPASAIYNQEARDFEFKPGAVFANLVVGDEINRASPKTQSALLEAMEERQVSVDGTTYVLETPFMVIATQNPIEMEGTYPLPEAQRDRFTARVSMGYPSPDAELRDARAPTAAPSRSTTSSRSPTRSRCASSSRSCARVHVSDEVKRYVVDLVSATRASPDLRLGASPRAGLQLVRAARAHAALDGRDYVLPDDVQELAVPGARPPAAADRRGAGRRAAPPRRSSPTWSRAPRCRTPAAPRGAGDRAG